jgi:polar amino acid transport system substrate-binding protein
MHLNRTVLLLTALLLWPGPDPGFCADRSVRLATLEWEPYIGRDLEGFGFGAEILREAFHRAGYEVTFSFMPWVRALKEAELGRYDAVCFAYHSKERAGKYLFSAPYAESTLGFCTLQGSGLTVRGLEDLAPYRIGVVRGFVNTPEFDALETLRKEEVKNEWMNLKKLLNGRVDVIVIDRFVMRHVLKTHFPDRKDTVDFLEPPLAVHPLHLMFSKQREHSAAKLRAFNRAVETMRQDGSMDRIMARFGYGDGQ